MDLKEYYFQNVKPEDYHYKFFESISTVDIAGKNVADVYSVNNNTFDVFDAEDAIVRFRELCLPGVNFNAEKLCWFYLISYYLYSLGYEIKEFPRLLARPPVDPLKFSYDAIRNRIIANGDDDNGTVRYATRRVLVSKLSFEVKNTHINIDESIKQKFIEISNRSSSFDNMSTDEKLAEIANLIENLLKKNGKFLSLDYSTICFDYISDEMITAYRKRMHCFRHSAEDSIIERGSYTENQKGFFVDYGLTIVKVIYALVEQSK